MLRRCYYNPAELNQVHSLIQTGTNQKDCTTQDEEMVHTLWDLYKKTGYLSARILDHLNISTWQMIDPYAIIELVESLPKRPFPILPTHDMFRCHPNYGNDLRKQYILQLHLIAKSNLLQHILSFLTKKPIKVNKLADFSKEILQTNYALS